MALVQSKNGQFTQADFFNLLGGLNNTDSPFRVAQEQAVAGYNYDYIATGGIQKRQAHTLLNTGGVDGQTNSLGMFVHKPSSSSTKVVLRAAGINLQTVNQTTGVCTTVTNDASGAGSTAFSSAQQVCFSEFITIAADTTWFAGGGQGSGVINGFVGNSVKYTQNGAAIPVSSGIGVVNNTAGTQSLASGTYFYSLALVKASTGVISNASCDVSATVTNGSAHVVTLTFNLTGLDTTKYNFINIYRSVISGSTGFTVGDLVAQVASSATTVTDNGAVSAAGSLNIPRAGNTVIDNSVLAANTYNVVTTWKNRLVTASGSTVYFSDVNKPESWPLSNVITIPSGGPILALGVVYFSTPTTPATDQYLAIFKEKEMWVVTGNYFVTFTNSSGTVTQQSDIVLKFIDTVGCVSQNSIVTAKGNIYWIDVGGFYMWTGQGKPIYLSWWVEYDFQPNGDIDTGNLNLAIGQYFQKQNEVVWYIASKNLGKQFLSYKIDIRLTMSRETIEQGISGGILNGIFIKDSVTYPIYALADGVINGVETCYGAGNDGRIWQLFDNPNSENGQSVPFSYQTNAESFGSVGVAKRFHKVIVWCEQTTLSNLTLNYWTNYQLSSQYEVSKQQPITQKVTNSYWDIATWDSSNWDTLLKTYSPVIFNLPDAEGDALTLQFVQNAVNTQLIIAGYSVLYTNLGLRH